MTIEPYICPLDPDTNSTLKLYLYKNVKNIDQIRNNVVKGIWNCAVIKPCLILDPFQVVAAANKAVVSNKCGGMVTRTVHSEILYNLSLTRNISRSLCKFGVEAGDALLLCVVVDSDDDKTDDILPQIQGELRPIDELRSLSDVDEIKNTYKLDKICIKSDYELLDNIVSRIVTKNFILF